MPAWLQKMFLFAFPALTILTNLAFVSILASNDADVILQLLVVGLSIAIKALSAISAVLGVIGVLKKSPKLIRIWAVGLLFFSAWFVAIFSLTEIAKDFLGNDYYSTGAVTYGVQFTILNILALMDLEDDHDQVIHQNAR